MTEKVKGHRGAGGQAYSIVWGEWRSMKLFCGSAWHHLPKLEVPVQAVPLLEKKNESLGNSDNLFLRIVTVAPV